MDSIKYEFLQYYGENAWIGFLRLINKFSKDNILDYKFINPEQYLFRALLVRGSKFESTNFQRLEFLGDAILSLVISRKIYTDYVWYDEELLTELRSHITRNETLSQVFDSLNLNELANILEMKFSTNQKADLVEALIAAVYIDSEWDETTVEKVIERLLPIEKIVKNVADVPWGMKSPKNHLTEMIQKVTNNSAKIEIAIVKMGKANAPKFTASIRYYNAGKPNTPKYNITGEPQFTKRKAERSAIEKLLLQLYTNEWKEYA